MMGSKLLRAGDTERGFAGWINRRFDRVRRAYEHTLTGTLHYRPVVLTLWAIVAVLMIPFYMFSQRELAPAEDQGVVFGVIQASPNSTIDQTRLFTNQVYDVYHAFPESQSIFQITSPTGGFGGMVTKPWSERKKTAQQLLLESTGPLSKIAGIRVIPLTPPPLPGGGDFPVDFVIASPGEPQQLVDIAKRLVGTAFASGKFIYADSDLKYDQPQAEVVFDRDKLRSQGVDLSQAGQDLSTMLGGNYVNRFSIQGRSYKVIPQVTRAERLTPEQLSQIYVTGSQDKLVPLSTFATLKTTTEPRDLKKFQQLNAVRIQGVVPPGVPLDQALKVLEAEAKTILPQGFTVDYAGESRQLRTEGSKFLGTFLLSGNPDLPGSGGAVRELPRSFHHSRGVGTTGYFRSAAVLVPGVDDAQHIQSGGVDHASRPGVKERHPDRGVCQPSAGNREGQAGCDYRGVGDPAAAHSHDDGGYGNRTLSTGAGQGAGSRSAQQHRHHAGQRNDHWNALYALHRAIDLHAGSKDAHPNIRRGCRFGEMLEPVEAAF